MTSNKTNQELLTRVRTVYYLRRLGDPVIIKCTSLFALLLICWFQISLLDIFANTPSVTSPGAFSVFFYRAFANTEWMVKTLVIAISMFTLGLALPAVRFIKPSRFMPVINFRRFQPFRFN